MITIELRNSQLSSGAAVRGRALLDLDGPSQAIRVTATLTCHQTIRSPFSGKPPTRNVFHSSSVEIAGAASYFQEQLSFDLNVPFSDELDVFPETPQLLQRLVTLIAPDAIGPVCWDLEVRVERRWKTDVVASLPLEIVVEQQQACSA